MRTLSLMALLLIPATSALAGSDLYLPLVPGATWAYTYSGGTETQSVAGTEVVRGVSTSVIEYESAENDGLRQFWTTAPDGDVEFHGFVRPEVSAIYDPPIVFVDAPLSVGQTWSQTVDVYDYETMSYRDSFRLTFLVIDETTLSVPAGEFHAFGIRYVVEPAGLEQVPVFSIAGLPLTRVGVEWTDWWSEFTGRVQYGLADEYRLSSYEIPSTPVSERSWAQVKRLYR